MRDVADTAWQYLSEYRLWVLVLLALVLRLYRIDYPLADWHSFRQADTASVTREYIKTDTPFLEPRYHDLANIQSGQDNLDGYRMVEFPLVNWVTAQALKVLPGVALVPFSRLVSILFSLGTIIVLYYLVRDLSDERTAVLTAGLFAILPYSIFYSRAILPEMPLVFFSTLSIASFWWWLEHDTLKWFGLSVITLALGLLMKPFAAFLGLVYLAMVILQVGWRVWQRPLLFVFPLAFVPMFWWRSWIQQFPSGIPANDWLYNSNNIRFRPAWFRWLFYERLGWILTGLSGILLFPISLIPRMKKKPKLKLSAVTNRVEWIILLAWWASVGLYFVVIATGNVQHDYYQVLTLPLVCWSLAVGGWRLWDMLANRFSHKIAWVTLVLIIGIGVGLSWHRVAGYFNVNNWEYIRAGQRVDEIVPQDAQVIAPAFGDTKFLFQTNRRGWPIGFEIEDKIAKGADYYVTTTLDDEARELIDTYQVVEQTPEYVIIKLEPKATP